MLGCVPGFKTANIVLINGAEGREKQAENVAKERQSKDARGDEETTGRRG